ncbi:hypothetical protein SpCBS45565_g07620 [Spizellomyces sp. 'palustris']|nr:hypothetical protein SpCBS45565_g07620 [Spizellomyces sp. 'palustris']
MTSEESINLLAVVIDTNPISWATAAQDPRCPLDLGRVLEQLLIFINAHLALRFDNELVVIASHTDQSLFLYPPQLSDTDQPPDASSKPANTYKQFFDVNQAVIKTLKDLITQSKSPEDIDDKSMLAGSLSLAQTYINRIRRANDPTPLQSRILILSVSPDLPSQYIATMNCIFAAQRVGTRIDVCRFRGKHYGEESVFLPQACHLTGGSYMEIPEAENLLPYLLSSVYPKKIKLIFGQLASVTRLWSMSATYAPYVYQVSVSKQCPTCHTQFGVQ